MDDRRHAHFASLGELSSLDLSLAVDIWLEDAIKAPWATKETMKLAGILCRYMLEPKADRLKFKSIEDAYQLNADALRRSLVLFQLFGLVDTYSVEGSGLRAALRLSQVQLLRLMEAKHRLAELERGGEQDTGKSGGVAKAQAPWSPQGARELAASAPSSEEFDFDAGAGEERELAEWVQHHPFVLMSLAADAPEMHEDALPAFGWSPECFGDHGSADPRTMTSQDALARSLQRLQRRN